jgi:hypothetical protein
MSELSRRIEALPPEKRAILERQLLRRRAGSADAGGAIPRRPPGPCPLSFPQQRLWFLDQWRPGSPVYNAALPMRVRGPLDDTALEAALASVVQRHEVLRTVVRTVDDGPVQIVLDGRPFRLERVELSAVDPSEREHEGLELLRRNARRPFDLAEDLMLRATLVRFSDDDHLLQLEEHHIAFDGWSDGLLFEEVAELYAARLEGRDPELPELPIQYGDFAAWQRDRLQGERLDGLLDYWRAQLAGAPSILRLPTDRPRPAVQTFEGVHLPLVLEGDLGRSARLRAREEGVTPFILLLASFAALLYRLSGQDDVVVGSPIANRDQLELERLIGFFSNTLALRVRLGGNPTFRETVARVRETALGAYAHQDLPFEKIVEAVRPERDATANPLFQANFRVQTGEPSRLTLPGTDVEPVPLDVGFARFDVAIELQLGDERIEGYLEYNVGLFEPETAQRFARTYCRLLEQVLANPDLTLLELELPPPAPASSTRPGPGQASKLRRANNDPLPIAD